MHLEYFKNQILPLRDKLFRFAHSFLGKKVEAEDVVQEVFMRLWQKRGQLEAIQNIEAWSMTMTRNLSLDKLRSRKMEIRDLGSIENTSSPDMGLEEAFVQEETIGDIRKLIDTLNEKQKQVIILRDIEGYTYLEIGEIMGIDQNLVKVTLFRARSNIRKKLLKTDRYGL